MRYLFIFLSVGILFSSCGSQKKIATTQKVLTDIKEKQAAEVAKLTIVVGFSETRLQEGRIDSNIKNRIAEKLSKYQGLIDSARHEAEKIDSLMADKKEFRKSYKSYILPLLDSLQKNNAQYAERLSLYIMIEDGLDISNYQLFDLAAFFGSGKYSIPDDKTDIALVSFAPIIDSLIRFSNKYNERPRTASLVILGFADGAGFSNEGPLFDTLTVKIGRTDVSKEELNQKLSELRAEELIKQLTKVFLQKASSFINFEKLKIEYLSQGKGEAFPLPTIKDYLVDDPRRRIVLCYWVVLPN
jgi:outer membrane protein OmpA-like peptidoglycan-associated protein